ncbi:synaptophysin-like protein 1 [Clarias gariepinus]|uniref:synaptophysin-like protein 1 n=1 Tax=Clarias gariepinus TaxID=13013 RepID=UPI00234DDAC9|nr:synaptophysin-like protein 1 [Clarias gariepinus]
MQTGFRLNLSPVKEPLGFIKLLEWFTAVFAFGCCSSFSGRIVISLFCANGTNETVSATFSYPFRLNQVLLVKDNATVCNRSVSQTHLVGDASSSVEFFVAVGVLAFLYCMIALLVYLGYMHVYRDSNFGPAFDFLVTSAFAVLWLVCSSAWARGLQKVKYATGTEGISQTLCTRNNITCDLTEFASTRSLDVSVVLGFLNLIIWSLNAWFVYKETCWHSQKGRSQQEAARGRGPGPI